MPTDVLVGSTGFVGGNIALAHSFDLQVHSTDVANAYGSKPDLVVYAGVPSAMFLANKNPEADLDIMRDARENLQKIAAKKVVLISTIAVYADSRGKTESDSPSAEGLGAYGSNRLQLEEWVREDFDDCLVMRLPALYGRGLKKNFLRDLVHPAPPMLKDSVWAELKKESSLVEEAYACSQDGFYRMRAEANVTALDAWFAKRDFNALSFTDSRSRYQFYDLSHLWNDISHAVGAQRRFFNLSTPPVSAAEVYEHVMGRQWKNELEKKPYDYDMRTLFSPGEDGYLCSRKEELDGILHFVRGTNA